MIGEDSIRYNIKDKKFLVYDFETSNLNLGQSKFNRIWQASFSIYEGYNIKNSYNYYLKWPNFKISKGAALATRFDPNTIEEKGVEPEPFLKLFDSYLYDESIIPVGHNILNFDVYLHNLCREELGKPTDYSYISRCLDTRALFSCFQLGLKFKPDEDFINQQYRFLDYKKKGFKSSLAFAAKTLGISVDETTLHDSKNDIDLTFKVLLELIKKIDI